MGRITANDRMWDIIDRCREGNIKEFGVFYGNNRDSVYGELCCRTGLYTL